MVCRDNFFNVKYAIDMAELTGNYIKGFVKACFDAGVHEKQAAAMLDLVANDGMEKLAASPSFWKGLGQVITGTGNMVGGAGKALLDGGSFLKPIGRGIKGVHNTVMAEPIKHYVKDKNYLAALTHMGVFGALPPAAALTGVQNWRANSDSKLADAINDYLGTPEFLVFGRGDSPLKSTATYKETSSPSTVNNDSPFNIPGTTNYTPGERKLMGGSSDNAYNGEIPESVRPLIERRRDLKKAIADLKNTRSRSISATERARAEDGRVKELQEELRENLRDIDDGLNEHNRQVGINARKLAQQQADALRDLSSARRRDVYQAGVGFRGDGALSDMGNKALELLGIRDDDAEAAARAQELRDLERRVKEVKAMQPGKEVDIPSILHSLDK